ncbi:GGDEF domain-containing protein [Noviherbaspirillum sp.]|uniref:GGDEF domain-containing protein n=1 Tax=Noviherbaspirillum sp. TaxID=1926288 RepID=UPI002FE33A4C
MPDDQFNAPANHSAMPTRGRRFWQIGIPFPESMEAAFQEEMDRVRLHRNRLTGLTAVVIYGLFAITDRVQLPDLYKQAWAIRFLLVMPLLALCTWGISRVSRVVVREILLASMGVIAAASIGWIACLSSYQYAGRLVIGLGLVLLFNSIVLSLRFRSALASATLIVFIFGASHTYMQSVTGEPTSFGAWVVFLAFVAIGLIGNFRTDQDQRRAFLATAREQERNEELSHAVALLGKLSAEDPLTQLANRREFDRRLALEWGRARRGGYPVALILADVDFFKSFNDRYGHPAGDACLKRVAAILRSVPQRSSDLAARLGGEEFGVLLPSTNIEDATQLAEQMRKAVLALEIPHEASGVSPMVTISFGVVAIQPGLRNDPAELLAGADAALYKAKKDGRNQVALYTA